MLCLNKVKRISQLDGVRGIAIILVLIWHYIPCQIDVEPGSSLASIDYLLGLTWSGVDLFFVLSGFLITGTILDNRKSSNFFEVFYRRRICRIFPLYFAVVGIYLLFLWSGISKIPSIAHLFEGSIPMWSYLTFTQNIFMGWEGNFGADILAVTWSLAVEEQFYLVVPFIAYFLPKRHLLCLFAVLVIAAPLLRVIYPGFHTYIATPWRLDALLSGASLALLVRSPVFMDLLRRHMILLISVWLALLTGAAVITLYPGGFGAFRNLWLAFLYATFVLLAYADGLSPLTALLRSRILVWFGQLSYGIYLIHDAMLGLMFGLLKGRPPGLVEASDGLITGGALLLSLLLASLSFRYFETPFLRMGHRAKYNG